MNIKGFEWNSVKQLNISRLLLATFIPSIIAFFGFHYIAPMLVNRGIPSLYSWLIVANSMLFVLVFAAIILLRREAKQLKITIFERMCFQNISGKLWLVSISIMLFSFIAVSGAKKITNLIIKATGFVIPEYSPFFLNPSMDPSKTDLLILVPGVTLKGNFPLIIFFAVALLLNILAEELYFRAWMLPKTSAYGKWAWVINGTLFAVYHTFQIWLFPLLIVASLSMAYVFNKTKSIWPSLLGHLIGNFVFSILGLFLIAMGLE